ncbi:unnamed protein product [Pleuronectes platessa]|uniref:Uncharacterized protein n=1 Tax=Pleuronectes platessa TaxID=8262 RepID=A0A9N7W486_PLEPL|nr:unnamed protein product [Pleuronectes platessa]
MFSFLFLDFPSICSSLSTWSASTAALPTRLRADAYSSHSLADWILEEVTESRALDVGRPILLSLPWRPNCSIPGGSVVKSAYYREHRNPPAVTAPHAFCCLNENPLFAAEWSAFSVDGEGGGIPPGPRQVSLTGRDLTDKACQSRQPSSPCPELVLDRLGSGASSYSRRGRKAGHRVTATKSRCAIERH